MRGRKPKPTAIRILEGNPGKRPINKNEPKPQPLGPECPDFVQGKARAFWNEYAPILMKQGVLTELDEFLFGALCVEYADYLQHGATVRKMRLLRSMFAEFGMTPATRL